MHFRSLITALLLTVYVRQGALATSLTVDVAAPLKAVDQAVSE
jgi:hypothetical protein